MSRRCFACMLTLVSTAIGMAHAVPSRPLYLPPEPPKLPPIVTVQGTTWSGHLYTNNENITFHAGGTLTYTNGPVGNMAGGSPGNWRLNGNQLWFQVNNFSEFETTITGDTIQGTGINKSGQKTNALMHRVGTAPVNVMPR